MVKRAVLVGVNRYLIPGADLRGCVNDVHNMKKTLVELFGFRPRDLVILLDDKATKRNIQAALRQMIRASARGDVALFHFSGHGSNVPDKDGDEADHRDEILCPHDLDWRAPLADDWLRSSFDKLRAGVQLTCVFDCCHSGTATRQVAPPDAPVIARYLPSPWDLVAAESGRRLRGKVRGTVHRAPAATRRRSDVVVADMPEVLLSGCRASQTSADAWIGNSFNGALTHSLVASLREAGGDITYRELHAKILQRLKRGKFDQVPQLEGRRAMLDRPFLAAVE
ncbi:MAG: caspase family protein [Burkholderiales bacterium]|nr:caspase family protein [Burkholderiales bacterium]